MGKTQAVTLYIFNTRQTRMSTEPALSLKTRFSKRSYELAVGWGENKISLSNRHFRSNIIVVKSVSIFWCIFVSLDYTCSEQFTAIIALTAIKASVFVSYIHQNF